MKVEIEPGSPAKTLEEFSEGKYVVAVSGGVDSVALLHMLKNIQDIQLIVAHFDHGIRPDSREDCEFVAELAKNYGLEFFSEEGHLGIDASEALARRERYEFLHRIKEETGAQAIITAHHQDDVIETAILNLLRGSGRRGLSSLRSTDEIKRPLLNISKQEILDYVAQNNLQWREDSTNQDLRYFRNYIRQKIVPKMDLGQRAKFLQILADISMVNQQLDAELEEILAMQPTQDRLNRQFFIMLPHAISKEVMAAWLRNHDVQDISTKMLERLVVQAKTLSPGQKTNIDKHCDLEIRHDVLALEKHR